MRNQLENVQEKDFEQLFTNDNPPVQTFHPTRSKCSKEFSCLKRLWYMRQAQRLIVANCFTLN